MDRDRKREIRIKINDLLDNECKHCEHYSWANHQDYCSRECKVGHEFFKLSRQLLLHDIENSNVDPEQEVSIPLKVGKWSHDEEVYLLNHSRFFNANHIAQKLNRSKSSVNYKLHQLRKRQRRKESIC